MQTNEFKFCVEQNVKFSKSTVNSLIASQQQLLHSDEQNDQMIDCDAMPDVIGGVLDNGKFGWLATGSHLEVISMRTGERVASYTFDGTIFPNTLITCVSEIQIPELGTRCLTIGAQCSQIGGLLIVFAVQGSRILGCIEIVDKVTSCSFVPETVDCEQNALKLFDGCVAVGTDLGKVILIDLKLKDCKEILYEKRRPLNGIRTPQCQIFPSNVGYKELETFHNRAKIEDQNFGVQLEALENTGPVLSILPLEHLSIIAVGFADGRMILYDLFDLEAFHMAYPPEKEMSLIRMSCLEPADDPRACVYIWAFHANADTAIAVMHSVMFEKRTRLGAVTKYKNFQSSSPRLTLPTFEKSILPIACQSVFKPIPDEEGTLSLCLLAWTSSVGGGMACLFDLNQWYKEQMPNLCDWRLQPTYLICLPLDEVLSLDIWLSPDSVIPFNSIQRPEEHFYPSSLTFDCTLFSPTSSVRLHWPGLQNQILESFSRNGPNAILDPRRFYDEMNDATLMPQFFEATNGSSAIRNKQNFLLSIALEYNCVGLLKECARAWADGSHIGRPPFEGLSLSSLTDWLWSRANAIKTRCNDLCSCLFDYSGCTLDSISRKELWNCSRQLHLLADILLTVLTQCKQFIPSHVLDMLQSQHNSIQMTFEYQEVVQWLLNMGLLPEGMWSDDLDSKRNQADEHVPYPYRILQNYYLARRRKFYEINRQWICSKTKICRMLYIDQFIEKDCQALLLRNEWKRAGNDNDGLYPPVSMQAMLRTLLVPGIPIEKKYMLFVYLFLDINMALNDERYSGVVQNLIKFPAVFKLNPSLIKMTQAFWHLDHGEFETSVEELILPFSKEGFIAQWQQELLIQALLAQGAQHLALRSLRAPRSPIGTGLEIQTLLANNLIAEAFQVQRAKGGGKHLEEFFNGCYEHQKWGLVLELDLTTAEEECLGTFLKTRNTSLSDNLHFVYLLQRGKYMKALVFIDELQSGGRRKQRLDIETPNTILESFKLTMTPSVRNYSNLYYSIKDTVNLRLNKDRQMPIPLSSKMMQKNFSVNGGVYQCALLSTEQTSNSYCIRENERQSCHLSIGEVPFLRNPQYDLNAHIKNDLRLCQPEPYVPPNKKRPLEREPNDEEDLTKEFSGPKKRQRLDSTSHLSGINQQLLTSFKNRSPKQTVSKTPDKMSSKNARNLIETTLNTPIVKSSKQDSSLLAVTLSSERPDTPQSILKVKGSHSDRWESSLLPSQSSYSPNVTSMSLARHQSYDGDDKMLRFTLPESSALDNIIEFNDETRPEVNASNLIEIESKPSLGRTSTSISILRPIEESFNPESIAEQTIAEEVEETTTAIVHSEPIEMDISEKTSPIKSELPYSLRMSPNRRLRNFADGPKARRRLGSVTEHHQTIPSERFSLQRTTSKSESPEKSNPTITLNVSSRSQSEDRDLATRNIENRFPLGRRTYRQSNINDIQASLPDHKSSTPRRKSLSQMVLMANAKKITKELEKLKEEEQLQNASEPTNASERLNETETGSVSDISFISLIDKQSRLFPDNSEFINEDHLKVTIEESGTDESFLNLIQQKRILEAEEGEDEFTTFEGNWSSQQDSGESAEMLDDSDENVAGVDESKTSFVSSDIPNKFVTNLPEPNLEVELSDSNREFLQRVDQIEARILSQEEQIIVLDSDEGTEEADVEEERFKDDDDDDDDDDEDDDDDDDDDNDDNEDEDEISDENVNAEMEEIGVDANEDDFDDDDDNDDDDDDDDEDTDETSSESDQSESNPVVIQFQQFSTSPKMNENEIIDVSSDSNNSVTNSLEHIDHIETEVEEYNPILPSIKPAAENEQNMIIPSNSISTESIQSEVSELEPNDKLILDGEEIQTGENDPNFVQPIDAAEDVSIESSQNLEVDSIKSGNLNEAYVLSTDVSLAEHSEFLTASEAENSTVNDHLDVGFVTINSSENTQVSVDAHINPEDTEILPLENESEKEIDLNPVEETTNDPKPSTSRAVRSKSRDTDIKIKDSVETVTIKPQRRARANSMTQSETKTPFQDSPSHSAKRPTRAASVPKLMEISIQLDDQFNTPSKRVTRRSSLLLDGDHQSASNPSPMTRSASRESLTTDSPLSRKTRSQSVQSLQQSPTEILPITPTRKRGADHKEDDSPVNLTPRRRSARLNSRDTNDADDTASVVSAHSIRSTRSTRSTRSKSGQTVKSATKQREETDDADADFDNQSIKSSHSNRSLVTRGRPKKNLAIISEDQPMDSMDDDYSTSRRLTRNQTAVMNKVKESMKKARRLSTTTNQTINENEEDEDDRDVNMETDKTDTESNISIGSSASRTRSGRQKANSRKNESSDQLNTSGEMDDAVQQQPQRRTLRKRSTSSSTTK